MPYIRILEKQKQKKKFAIWRKEKSGFDFSKLNINKKEKKKKKKVYDLQIRGGQKRLCIERNSMASGDFMNNKQEKKNTSHKTI